MFYQSHIDLDASVPVSDSIAAAFVNLYIQNKSSTSISIELPSQSNIRAGYDLPITVRIDVNAFAVLCRGNH